METNMPELAGDEPEGIAEHPAATDEAIRRRAYELYEARGGADGDDVADWLTAERELAERRSARPEELGEPPRENDPEDER